MALSSPRCRTCKNLIGSLEAARARGFRYEGGQIRVKGAAATRQDDETVVLVDFSVPELRELDRGGRQVQAVASARAATWQLTLQRSRDRWLVREVVLT